MRLKALLLCMLVFIGMISGVYATWVFTETAPVEQYGEIYVNVNAFNYTPEAVLPSDPEADKLGQNHLDLIKKILYEANHKRSDGEIKVPVESNASGLIKVYIDNELDSEMAL